MIRVAHVAQQLAVCGGMERLLEEIARHADRSRLDLRFIALGARGPVADRIESHGWPVTALNLRPGLHPAALFKLASQFLDDATDVVHTHNTGPLIYAAPAARLARVGAVIHTRHGQRHGATPRQTAAFRAAAFCADRIITVSEESASRSVADGLNPARLRVIPGGIDLNRLPFSGPRPGGSAVFVGRLSPEKDINTLLRATKLIVARDPSFRLVIAGAGPCSAELRSLAAHLRLTAHVDFPGEVTDVPALLRRASMLVLPSRSEGLPLTILEAMSSGLPVVATAVGGVPEAVTHNHTGLLVAPTDPAALANAITRLHHDPTYAARLGLAGHLRATQLFDIRTMVARYESTYDELLSTQTAAA